MSNIEKYNDKSFHESMKFWSDLVAAVIRLFLLFLGATFLLFNFKYGNQTKPNLALYKYLYLIGSCGLYTLCFFIFLQIKSAVFERIYEKYFNDSQLKKHLKYLVCHACIGVLVAAMLGATLIGSDVISGNFSKIVINQIKPFFEYNKEI